MPVDKELQELRMMGRLFAESPSLQTADDRLARAMMSQKERLRIAREALALTPFVGASNALQRRSAIGTEELPPADNWLNRPIPHDPAQSYFLPLRLTEQGREWGGMPGLLRDAANTFTASGRAKDGLLADPREEAFNFATYVMGGGLLGSRAAPVPRGSVGMNAYHGSPHKFDAFDMSKIGTGEGAQAYGHGLYFAENPKVAREYVNLNPSGGPLPPPRRTFMGRELDPGSPEYHAARLVSESKKPIGSLVKEVEGWINAGTPDRNALDGWRRTLEVLKAANSRADFKTLPTSGHLYHVDIPDEAVGRMLDWDKPLSQQPQAVQDALKPLQEAYRNSGGQSGPYLSPSATGSQIYTEMRKWAESKLPPGAALTGKPGWTQKLASDELKSAGIPGIRYLDAGSRTGGEGTRNIVLFDDKLATIKKRE